MVSNLKSWFQKLQKSSILKSAALVILWGEEKKGRKKPRFLIFKDRGFQAKFVSFFSENLTMSLFLVREWYKKEETNNRFISPFFSRVPPCLK